MTNGAELKLGGSFTGKGVFEFHCVDKYGNFKWDAVAENLVTDTGIAHMMDLTFTGGGTQQGTWYIGLLADTDIKTTDIIGGISEATEYTGNRPAWVEARSAKVLTNSGNLATFTFDKDGTTVDGGFLNSSNLKAAPNGILFSGAAFAAGKVGDSGDVLTVTYSLTFADNSS